MFRPSWLWLHNDLKTMHILSAADFCCNGNVVEDIELGKIIQLQGDQRRHVSEFLIKVGARHKLSVGQRCRLHAAFFLV